MINFVLVFVGHDRTRVAVSHAVYLLHHGHKGWYLFMRELLMRG